MHILIRESPQRFEQGDEQQRLFTIGARATTCSFGQRWRATPMGELNRQAAPGQQMQGFNQLEGIDM
jgi:hypothetical protein